MTGDYNTIYLKSEQGVPNNHWRYSNAYQENLHFNRSTTFIN